jgi:hypothetical protein
VDITLFGWAAVGQVVVVGRVAAAAVALVVLVEGVLAVVALAVVGSCLNKVKHERQPCLYAHFLIFLLIHQ